MILYNLWRWLLIINFGPSFLIYAFTAVNFPLSTTLPTFYKFWCVYFCYSVLNISLFSNEICVIKLYCSILKRWGFSSSVLLIFLKNLFFCFAFCSICLFVFSSLISAHYHFLLPSLDLICCSLKKFLLMECHWFHLFLFSNILHQYL